MAERKIIQIAVAAGDVRWDRLFALADDGSLWVSYVNTYQMAWNRLQGLPAPSDPKPTEEA